MNLFDFLSHGFIQRALIAGSFIAVLCSTLGVFLVLRRFSLVGEGLGHVTFGSVAIGLFFGVYPIAIAIPIAMIASLGMLKLTERAYIYGDTAIGIVSSLGIATGVIIASLAGGFNIDLFSYLFGSILTINAMEVGISIILSFILIFIIYFYYQELLAITFDEESARASGIKVGLINKILVLLTAVTVVLAMKVVGIMLVSALLILPSVTALQLNKGFKTTIIFASLSGVISVMLGIFISFMADLPPGATIVVLNFLFFVLALFARMLRS